LDISGDSFGYLAMPIPRDSGSNMAVSGNFSGGAKGLSDDHDE
jgi:hypothetical protein